MFVLNYGLRINYTFVYLQVESYIDEVGLY